MKILYFVNGLDYKGGIARIVSDKANYLSDETEHFVYICTLKNCNNSYPISNKINILTLGIERGHGFFYKLWLCVNSVRKLRKTINKIQPDIIVNAQTELVTWILPFINRKIPKIMEIHFSKDGMKYNVRGKSKLFRFVYWHSINFFYSKYTKFVVLTPEDKQQWKLKNCVVINNFTRLNINRLSTVDKPNIICVGRYCVQKRLDLLVETWRKIAHKYPQWNIYVYGGGRPMQKAHTRLD